MQFITTTPTPCASTPPLASGHQRRGGTDAIEELANRTCLCCGYSGLECCRPSCSSSTTAWECGHSAITSKHGTSSGTKCDIFPVHFCHLLLCHHCTCVHFRRALESQAKRCIHILSSHRVAPIAHRAHSPQGARVGNGGATRSNGV